MTTVAETLAAFSRPDCVFPFLEGDFAIWIYLLHHLHQQTPPSGANRQTSSGSIRQSVRSRQLSTLEPFLC